MKEEICYGPLKRGETSTIMPLWQAVVLEKWLLVKDPLQPNHLVTTVIAGFVKDCMQDIAFGDI